jgi:hypothetical protein
VALATPFAVPQAPLTRGSGAVLPAQRMLAKDITSNPGAPVEPHIDAAPMNSTSIIYWTPLTSSVAVSLHMPLISVTSQATLRRFVTPLTVTSE